MKREISNKVGFKLGNVDHYRLINLTDNIWALIINKLIKIDAINAEKLRLVSKKFTELILGNIDIYYKMFLMFVHKNIIFQGNSSDKELYGGLLFQYFGWSCIEGELDLAKWMIKKYEIINEVMKYRNTLLKSVCINGKFEICKWLVETFNLEGEHINNALIGAYESGNLDMIKWLHSKTCLTQEDVTTIKYYPFQRIAAQNGHLEVLQWFHSVFKLTKQDIMDGHVSQAFCVAVENGHLDIIKWFCSIFDITATDIVYNGLFQSAARMGKLEVLKWLYQNYNMEITAMDDCYRAAFSAAAENRQLCTLQWLKDTFNI